MGVYIRKDSPYYWFLLERKGKMSLKESSRILISTGDPTLDAKNKVGSRIRYAERLNEIQAEERRAKKIMRQGRQLGEGYDGSWAYVYFIRQGTAIKIGKAINVLNRLRSLNVGAPEPMELLAAVPAHSSVETALHAKFKSARIRGEWFLATPELEGLIRQVQSGLDIATAVFQLRDADANPRHSESDPVKH